MQIPKSKRKLIIDCRMWDASGIGVYLRETLGRLERELPDFKFELLGDPGKLKNFGENFNIVKCTYGIYSWQEQLLLGGLVEDKESLFWSPHFNIPFSLTNPFLVTIHDVFHLAMKEFISAPTYFYAKALLKRAAHRSKKIMTDSEFSKTEIQKYLGIPSEKIEVIYCGLGQGSENFDRTGWVDKNYILAVGNLKPHKNLVNLVKAFRMIRESVPHQLKIVGDFEGLKSSDKELMEELKRDSGQIDFLGKVDQQNLIQLYKNASVFVFPSLYEGFGLPPLEAMTFSCPVIASNLASIPEICGDAPVYCDAQSPASISESILRVLSDNQLREKMRGRGLEQIKKFSWDRTANRVARLVVESLP